MVFLPRCPRVSRTSASSVEPWLRIPCLLCVLRVFCGHPLCRRAPLHSVNVVKSSATPLRLGSRGVFLIQTRVAFCRCLGRRSRRRVGQFGAAASLRFIRDLGAAVSPRRMRGRASNHTIGCCDRPGSHMRTNEIRRMAFGNAAQRLGARFGPRTTRHPPLTIPKSHSGQIV